MAPETNSAATSLCLLVIEDDRDTRANLGDILGMDGHEVSLYASIAEALQHAEWPKIDVLIIDRNLPDGRAERWIPQLKQVASRMDIVVVTAYADLDSTIHALRERVADYLIKPINPESLLASLHAIGRRRLAEQELSSEREFNDRVLDTSEAIILILDSNGNIVRYNRFLEELSGYPLSEVIGRCWFTTFLPEEDRAWVQAIFSRTVQFSESRGVLNPIRTRFGRLRQIRWSNSLLRDHAGQIQSVLSIGLDVTDLVDAQQRALQAERLATIGQTMAALAHESRNALQRIQAGVELLELDLGPNSQGLEDLRRIEKAAIDLRGLLEEVRSYAAPIQLDRAECSLANVWRRAWESLESERKNRDAELLENHPNKSDSVMACVDATRLQQVFRNLFENSLSITPGPVRIRIACRSVGHQIVIQVSDNGPGISAEQQLHLFEPFYTTRPSGTGLGLAIAQRIIEAHEGTIVCASHKTTGAEFEIVLPISHHPPSRQPLPVLKNT